MGNDKFIQPVDGIEVEYGTGPATLLPQDVLQDAARRIAAGEDRDKVLTELAILQVELEDELREDGLLPPEEEVRGAEFNPDQPRDESGRWTDTGGNATEQPRRGPGRFIEEDLTNTRGARNPRGFPEDDFIRGEEMPDRMERAIGASIDNSDDFKEVELTWEAKEAIQRYRGNQFIEMGLNAKTSGEQYSDLTKDVQALQTALTDDKLYLSDPIIVYRGISMDQDKAKEFLSKLEPGDVMETSGFQSSATSVESAAQFLASAGGVTGRIDLDRGIMMEIKARQGLHIGSDEAEFLMPHGSRYRVVAIKNVLFHLPSERWGKKTGEPVRRSLLQVEQIGGDYDE